LTEASDLNIPIKLFRTQDQSVLDGSLVTLSDKHLRDVSVFWKPRLATSEEEDSHWDWYQKYQGIENYPNYEKYSVECEQITQGLMMIEIDCHRSRHEPDKSIVYVDFLATAPWNRPSLESPPQFRGVGSVLFDFARQRSRDLEYQGRLGLHSLSRAESFYLKQGMKNFGPDHEKQDLTYFELKRDQDE
jgi:hypothetical protein